MKKIILLWTYKAFIIIVFQKKIRADIYIYLYIYIYTHNNN